MKILGEEIRGGPAQRRFISPDPLMADPIFSTGRNRFAYVLNNPLRYSDPTGMNGIVHYHNTWNANEASSKTVVESASIPTDHYVWPRLNTGDDPGPDLRPGEEKGSTDITPTDGHSSRDGSTAVQPVQSSDDHIVHKARGSERDPKIGYHDDFGDWVRGAGETCARSALVAVGGEGGALVGMAVFDGGAQMASGMINSNGDDVEQGATRLLITVGTAIAARHTGRDNSLWCQRSTQAKSRQRQVGERSVLLQGGVMNLDDLIFGMADGLVGLEEREWRRIAVHAVQRLSEALGHDISLDADSGEAYLADGFTVDIRGRGAGSPHWTFGIRGIVSAEVIDGRLVVRSWIFLYFSNFRLSVKGRGEALVLEYVQRNGAGEWQFIRWSFGNHGEFDAYERFDEE